MNENIQEASFSIQDYEIYHFRFTANKDIEKVRVHFAPSGVFNKAEKTFQLLFDFTASFIVNEEDVVFLETKMGAVFLFDSEIPFEGIPDYFFGNSIAIVFPYLRAFVTTLTTLSQTNKITLPILNLTNLSEELKSKTQQV